MTSLYLTSILAAPWLVAFLALRLPHRMAALTAVGVGTLTGLLAILQSLTRINSGYVDLPGLQAWWGGTCILASIIGLVLRMATNQRTQPRLSLLLAASLCVVAFSYFAGQLFEPLGGMLTRL